MSAFWGKAEMRQRHGNVVFLTHTGPQEDSSRILNSIRRQALGVVLPNNVIQIGE